RAGDFGLARYGSGGSLDGGFGSGGKVTTDFSGGSCDEGNDVAITSAGIVAAGTSNGRFALARYAQTTPAPPATPASDTTAPDSLITGGPKKKTHKHKATFSFSSSEPGSTFECKLDNQPFQPCTSPTTYKKLRKGRHTFQVRATDQAHNTDQSPATKSFKVI